MALFAMAYHGKLNFCEPSPATATAAGARTGAGFELLLPTLLLLLLGLQLALLVLFNQPINHSTHKTSYVKRSFKTKQHTTPDELESHNPMLVVLLGQILSCTCKAVCS